MRIIGAISIVFALSLGELSAQNTFQVFPQIVDGFNGSVSYKMSISIQNAFLSTSADCSLRTYGLNLSLQGPIPDSQIFGPLSTFSISVPAGGWSHLHSTGLQPIASGYATLTCSSLVYAHASYSLYANDSVNPTKLGEATVFSSTESFQRQFIADQTGGARLGIAIANNTDIAHDYKFTVFSPTGATIGTATVHVPGRSSLPKFLDEIVTGGTSNQITFVQIQAVDFSQFSAIGLRFTGSIFSTVPGY